MKATPATDALVCYRTRFQGPASNVNSSPSSNLYDMGSMIATGATGAYSMLCCGLQGVMCACTMARCCCSYVELE